MTLGKTGLKGHSMKANPVLAEGTSTALEEVVIVNTAGTAQDKKYLDKFK